MAKVRVLVDTDVLIKAYRNDSKAINDLCNIGKENIFISVVSAMELLAGGKNINRLKEISTQIKAYNIIHLDKYISQKAVLLMKEYVAKYPLQPADCLIAATSIVSGFPLLSDNKKHFDFIKNLKLYLQ